MFAKNYLKSGLSLALMAGALSLLAAPAMAQEEPSHQLESAISLVTTAPPLPEADAGLVVPAVPLEEADAAMVGGPMHMLKGELALTDEQYEKMYNLRSDFLDKFGPKMVEVASLERHLRDTLTSSSIDTKKAGEIKSKLAQAKSDIAELKTDMQIQMAQVLTSDQRKTLRLAMEKHCMGGCGRGRMMRHHMGGGGHGWGKHHHGGEEHGHGEHAEGK